MKTAKLFATLLLALFVFASCSESFHDEALPRIKKEVWRDYEKNLTKSIETRLSANGVSEEDVKNYLQYSMQISADEVKDITRYDLDDDVYIYIVNLVDGRWFFFSGDYSSGPIVGGGEAGGFYPGNDLSPHMEKWLASIRDHISCNRTETTVAKTIQDSRNKWVGPQRLSELSLGLPANLLTNNGDPDLDTEEVDIQIICDTLVFEDYASLTKTIWNQDAPWNNAMPKYDSTSRCLAGCAVIAIAQLLYYTHYAFGYPNDTYGQADCLSTYKDSLPYEWDFSNPSTQTWDYMTTDGWGLSFFDPYMPALCAHVAARCSTIYGRDKFPVYGDYRDTYGATYDTLVPGALASFMLDRVKRYTFNSESVRNEIKHNRPVLTGGETKERESHMFLIDGYYIYRFRETEIVRDMHGNVLSEQVYTYEDSFWRINTGNPKSRVNDYFSGSTYFPINRVMFIGWGQ